MTSATSLENPGAKKNGTALAYVLIFASALFIGILIVCYLITRQSHPIMLDEHGKPVASVPLNFTGSRS